MFHLSNVKNSSVTAACCLNYMDLIETVQLIFFKRFFNLPSNTENSAVRLELDILPLAFNIIKAALKWIEKFIKMNEDRLPKLCFMRLLQLSNDSYSACNPNLSNLNNNSLQFLLYDCSERY